MAPTSAGPGLCYMKLISFLCQLGLISFLLFGPMLFGGTQSNFLQKRNYFYRGVTPNKQFCCSKLVPFRILTNFLLQNQTMTHQKLQPGRTRQHSRTPRARLRTRSAGESVTSE